MHQKQAVFLKLAFRNVLFFIVLTCFFSSSSFAQRKKGKQTLDELILSLNATAKSDSAKIHNIYSWVVTNISYDYKTYMSGEPIRFQSPLMVYEKRKTTCTGYSNLLIYMLTKSGIPAFEVEGYTSDLTLGLDQVLLYDDHSWVAFKLNGNWQLCDPTWDAGSVGFLTIEAKELKGVKLLKERIKNSKVRKLFWSKKRKKKEEAKTKKDGFLVKKYLYKIGFIPQAKSDYIFQSPQKFAKTHLASIAHWQMNPAPLSISEFCDSIHQLTDSIRIKSGSFDYNALNDQYAALTVNDQFLWKADSIFNFNGYNSGDKCMNLNNYLNQSLMKSDYSLEQLDLLSMRTDSLNQSCNRALRTIKLYNSNKKRDLAAAFALERNTDKRLNKSLSVMQSLTQRNASIYAKGRSKIEQGDRTNLDRMLNRIRQDFELADKNSKASFDSLGILKQAANLQLLADSIRKVGTIEMNEPDSLITHFIHGMDTLTAFFFLAMDQAQSSSFIDEALILRNDANLEQNLQYLNKMLNDSLNRIFVNLKSMSLLQQYDVALSNLKALTFTKRSGWVKDTLQAHCKQLQDLILFENTVLKNRLDDSYLIEGFLKNMPPWISFFGKCVNSLSTQKSNRQKYLYNYLNMKVKRCTKAYTNVSKNGKLYKTRIKEMQRALKTASK